MEVATTAVSPEFYRRIVENVLSTNTRFFLYKKHRI